MRRDQLVDETLTHSIIGAFYDVYNTLGAGFVEYVYTLAVEHDLLARNHRVAREVNVPIASEGTNLCTQRLDMVVNDRVIIEIKSTSELHASAHRQLYNYLRATGIEVGLLFHFGPRPQFYRLYCRAAWRSS